MAVLALPSRGRYTESSLQLLKLAGFTLDLQPRLLHCSFIHPDFTPDQLQIIFIHYKDAGRLVEEGYVDIAVTGQDRLAETASNTTVLEHLPFGQCKIVLAIPVQSQVRKISDLEGATIATSYPNLTRSWFQHQKVNVHIQILEGALEITPWLKLSHGIIDSYQTGISVKVHNLQVLATLMSSQAVLIGRTGITDSIQQSLLSLLLKAAQKMYQGGA